MTAIDWPARRAEIVAADGDEWDRLEAAYRRDWQAVYCAEFIAYALKRRWTQEEAESWPDNIWEDSMQDGTCEGPIEQARHDVEECERESD